MFVLDYQSHHSSMQMRRQTCKHNISTFRLSWSSSDSSTKSAPSMPYHLFLIPWAAYICHLNKEMGLYVMVRFNTLQNKALSYEGLLLQYSDNRVK